MRRSGPVRRFVDRKLYVERWLLELKRRLGARGLEAHVRALDGRGGERLGLEVADGGAALALHYRKRRTGPAIVAAATGPEIVERAEEVHRAFVAEHRRWLENGLRRFGRRGLRLLTALRAAFGPERAVLERAAALLRGWAQAPEGSRPALAIRAGRRGRGRAPRFRGDFPAFPAVAVPRPGGTRLAAISERGLVDLAALFPEEEAEREEDRRDREGESPAHAVASGFLEVLDAGSELVSRLPPFRPPVRVPMPDLAESTAGAAEVASAAAEAMGRLAEVAGQAVETVSTAGSCLGDASCPGPDCGSVDCGSVDCGGL